MHFNKYQEKSNAYDWREATSRHQCPETGC
jgi:hypothetical protein